MLQRFAPTIYIQIEADTITMTHANKDQSIQFAPYMATKKVNNQRLVQAIGEQAKALTDQADITVHTPFHHPRALIADFRVAEKMLQDKLRELLAQQRIKLAPKIIIHPCLPLEGGLTPLETKVLRELAASQGARSIYLHVGRPLSSQQCLQAPTGLDLYKDELAPPTKSQSSAWLILVLFLIGGAVFLQAAAIPR